MKSRRLFILLLLILAPSFLIAKKNIVIQKGVLDLRSWNIENNSSFYLNGEWSFYWEQFLTQREINQKATQMYIPVPGSWTNSLLQEKSYPSWGYATYHLKVLLPKGFREELALKIPSIGTACRLFIDEELFFETGKIATYKEGSKAEYYTQNIHFKPSADSFDIIIQVSNYHHRKGGIWESIQFGISTKIQTARERKVITDCIMFGIMFMMFFYHIALYSLPPYRKSALYFGIGCFFASVRVLVVDEYILNEVINLPWEWVFKIEYLTFFMPIYVFPVFFKELFPKKFNRNFLRFLKWTILPMSAFCILAPPFYTSFLTIPAQFLFVIMNVYLLGFLVILKNSNREVIIFRISIFAIFMTTINDMLYIEDIIDSIFLSSFGFLIFLFAQAYLISMKFTQTYQRSELLSKELNVLNNRLEERIVERTSNLIDANQILSEQKDKITLQNDELIQKNQLLEELNQELKKLHDEKDALVDIVAHDLKAPLNRVKGLSELVQITQDLSEDGKVYLNKIKAVCSSGEELIKELLNISILDKEIDGEITLEEVNLEAFLKNIFKDYKSIALNKSINLHLEFVDNKTVTILTEENYLSRILDNLISNAIKFSYPNSNIWIKTKTTSKDEFIICIKDEGQGMTAKDKEKLFKKFQKLSARPTGGESSSGLGLSIVKALIEKLNGSVDVESKLGKGTEFKIKFPVDAKKKSETTPTDKESS